MLDVAYSIMLDDFKARLISDRQIIAMCLTSGAKDMELPDIDKEVERFNIWLSSSPEDEPEISEHSILAKALGLKK